MSVRFGKSIDDYLKVFHKALQSTWKHKYLWFFGLLAAGINAGSVFQGALDAFWDLKPADELGVQIVERSAENLPWLFTYTKMIVQMDAWRASLMITALLIFIIIFITITVSGQYLLTLGLSHDAKRRKKRSIKKLILELYHGNLWSLFSVNALAIIVQVILMCAASFPLLYMVSDNTASNIFAYAAIFLLLIPALFTVNIAAMLTVVNIVRGDMHLIEAAKHTAKKLKTNWIACIEVAAILFIINLIIGLAISIIIVSVIVPFGIFGALLLDTGFTGAVVLFSIIAGIISIALGAFYTAVMTTYNYSVWIHTAEALDKKSFVPAIESWFRAGLKMIAK